MPPLTPVLTLRCAWGVVLLLALLPTAADGSAQVGSEDAEFFEKKIRPVLAEHCYKCHSAEAKKPKGGLLVDSRAALLQGGDNGPALVAGDPDKSRLIQALTYKDADLQMPPKGKLPEAAIADLAAWVKRGAPWPGDQGGKAVAAKQEFDLHQRKRTHWAWQPLQRPVPPRVKDAAWPLDPVDQFILAKLEAKGLKPAPQADPRTLLRRLSFDLIGLPPEPAEASPANYAESVLQLLSSPHFGERWGRHWLDLVRYGETRGHEFDPILPNAFQYRDYVIRALNADVPYPQFVREHLAGDLLPRPRLHPQLGFNESILGTGFWFLGEEVHSPVDIRADQADRYDNRIDVLTKTFLGLTVSCARCHDHKFDAISTKDYYALFGFLESSSYRLVRFDAVEHNRGVAAALGTLRAERQPTVARALEAVSRQTAESMADYLLATREAAASGNREQVQEIARRRQLNPDRLKHWLATLNQAAKEENHPLHAWAKLAADPRSGDPAKFREALRAQLAVLQKREAEHAAALRGAEVVIDYARCQPADWLPDDFSYGPAPVRAGEPRWHGSTKDPDLRFAERGAAAIDRVWDGMKLAPATETEPGALGKQVRAGRTIRTPTFTITSGKLHYLVRGTGMAYAAVNAHTMIQGPLHGHLVTSIQAGDSPQWVTHNLEAYKGHRAHIEFSAAENADFAISLVVQGSQKPTFADLNSPQLVKLFAGDVTSWPQLAAAYQGYVLDLAKEIRTPEQARLANWLLQNSALSGEASAALAEVVSHWHAAEQQVAAQIRRESRLAMALRDANGVEEQVFIRGSHKALGERVPRRFLEALAGSDPLATPASSGRLELAEQMLDPVRNPLFARVIVNRVWHHLFGRGLVASVDNFGVLGDAPTHPELLDYLASEFLRDGGSLKRLIRRLVQTRTYQMASHAEDRQAEQADPENVLLHRMRLRRLQGEAIRDAMLAVSGRLDRTPFGPPVPTHLTPFMEGRGRPGTSGPLDGYGRRSIYLAVRRNFLSPLMLAFDTPSPFSTMGRRTVSNVPAQALILLNDPFVHQQAELWAKRTLAHAGTTETRIGRMYQSAFGRPPTAQEIAACKDFLHRQHQLASTSGSRPEDVASDPAVWKDLAHTLFNVKEFLFVK